MSATPKITTDRKLLGTMYVARRPCGKVSAATWIAPERAAEIAESVARWTARGDTVEQLIRYSDDPHPEWCCTGEPCACRDAESSGAAMQEGK